MKYTLFDKHNKTGLIEIKIINTKKTLKSCLSRYRCSICAPRVTRQTSMNSIFNF